MVCRFASTKEARQMTNVTDANPKQVIRQGSRDDDALLHGQYIGSFSSELQAWTDVDRVDLEQVQTGTVPEIAVSTSDQPTVTTTDPDDTCTSLSVPAADLEAAATRLRPDPAITKAL